MTLHPRNCKSWPILLNRLSNLRICCVWHPHMSYSKRFFVSFYVIFKTTAVGVPQGLILCSILLNLFVSLTTSLIQTFGMRLFIYADDTHLFLKSLKTLFHVCHQGLLD